MPHNAQAAGAMTGLKTEGAHKERLHLHCWMGRPRQIARWLANQGLTRSALEQRCTFGLINAHGSVEGTKWPSGTHEILNPANSESM